MANLFCKTIDPAPLVLSMQDKWPPETKRQAIGLALWLVGCICGGTVLFYLLYLLRMKLRHHHPY
jgi:hypothetical protein